MQAPDIRSATGEDTPAAIRSVVLGFVADPVLRWLWPDAATYLDVMPRFIRAFAGEAFEAGTAYVTSDCRAAALWLPPGCESDSAALSELIGETVAPRVLEDLQGVLGAMAAYHPRESHWYLPLTAVDPPHQGRGLGAALLKHALRRCDQDGQLAYLESTNVRNVPLYQRHGFEPIGEIQAGESPVMVPMLRTPR